MICQNYQGREYIGGADVALKCAQTADIDWETSGAGQCAGLDGSGKGSEGVALLKESVLLSKLMNIKYVLSVLFPDACSYKQYLTEQAAPLSSTVVPSVSTMGRGQNARLVLSSKVLRMR